MTKECVLKAIKRTDREVELAMETVRLYLKQEACRLCVSKRNRHELRPGIRTRNQGSV